MPTSTTYYVLRVRGPGGQDTAFVRVGVGEDLRETFLAAVPPVIDSGARTQLLWTAFHAKSVKLVDSAGQETQLDHPVGTGVDISAVTVSGGIEAFGSRGVVIASARVGGGSLGNIE